MKEKSAGISIGEGVIRVAILTKENDHIAVEQLEEIPFDSFDKLQENKEASEKLKAIFSKERIGSNVFVSIPDDKVIIRVKSVPKLPDAKILQIIHAEIKDYAIFSRENVSFGFVTSQENNDSKLIVWGGAKEKDIVNTMKFLRKCGIKARNIMPSNVALAKYVSTFIKEYEPYCTINLDRDTTTLTFVSNGRIIFTYMQDIGYKAFVENDTPSQATWVGNIITTMSYIARNLNISVEKVFFIQNTAEQIEAINVLKEKITFPVYVLSTPKLIQPVNDVDGTAIQPPKAANFPVAIGLASFGLYKNELPLYLLLNEHLLRERYSESLKFTALMIAFVVINGAFAISYPIIRNALINSQNNLKKVETAINEISQTADKVDSLTKELQSAKDTLSKYTNIKNTIESASDFSKVLNEIYAKCPQGVSVANISVRSDGAITLSGISNSFASVFDFEKNISTAKYVERASIDNINKGNEENIFNFNMGMFLKGSKK